MSALTARQAAILNHLATPAAAPGTTSSGASPDFVYQYLEADRTYDTAEYPAAGVFDQITTPWLNDIALVPSYNHWTLADVELRGQRLAQINAENEYAKDSVPGQTYSGTAAERIGQRFSRGMFDPAVFSQSQIDTLTRHWIDDDAEFGRRPLGGANPNVVAMYSGSANELDRLLTEGGTRDARALAQRLQTALSNRQLFWCDYSGVLGPVQRDRFVRNGQYWTVPTAFYVYDVPMMGLMPAAIRLNAGGYWFTPADDANSWLLAKLYTASADAQSWFSGTHLYHTHSVAMIFGIAALKLVAQGTLSLTHPILMLTNPLFPLATNWTVPPRNWLGDSPVCAGEAPVMGTDVVWWKTKTNPQTLKTMQDPTTNWFWFTRAGLPWRTIFGNQLLSGQSNWAVLGSSAMTYFPTFEAVSRTNLGALLKACPLPTAARAAGTSDLGGTVRASPLSDAERGARIRELIPGLTSCRTPDLAPPSLPRWLPTFATTVFMIPVDFTSDPLPTVVYYDWTRSPASQRTRMFGGPHEPFTINDALLLGPAGYNAFYKGGTVSSCSPLPGVTKPDWPTLGGCSCQGLITNNPQLSPNRTTMIMTCPMVQERIFWTWYDISSTPGARPITFMETASPPQEGTNLAIADYYDWFPNAKAPEGTFKLPPQCTAPSPAERPRTHHASSVKAGASGFPPACYTCHTGSGG